MKIISNFAQFYFANEFKKDMVKKLNIEKNFIAEISKNWQAGDMIVVSSRPGMGKSKFLLSIIRVY